MRVAAKRNNWMSVAIALLAAGPASATQQSAADSIAQARRLVGAGRLVDAVAAFQAVLRTEPRNATAHNALGSLLNTLGRYTEALPHAMAAVEIEPNNARYRHNRGIVLAEHGRFSEAIADFDAALAAQPDIAYAWLERGAARLSLGDIEGAQADWTEARRIAPELIWTRWYPATGDVLTGRYAEAAAAFDAVASAQPGFLPAHLWRLIAHGRAGGRLPTFAREAGYDWPGPVLEFYRGRLTEEQLLAFAGRDSSTGDRRRLGEALYFIGQYELIAGRRESAAANFRRALAVEAPRHVWKLSAEAELRRLEALAPR